MIAIASAKATASINAPEQLAMRLNYFVVGEQTYSQKEAKGRSHVNWVLVKAKHPTNEAFEFREDKCVP